MTLPKLSKVTIDGIDVTSYVIKWSVTKKYDKFITPAIIVLNKNVKNILTLTIFLSILFDYVTTNLAIQQEGVKESSGFVIMLLQNNLIYLYPFLVGIFVYLLYGSINEKYKIHIEVISFYTAFNHFLGGISNLYFIFGG